MVWLYTDDLVVIITVDGVFYGIWCDDPQDSYDNADEIQGWMCHVMKDPEHRDGVWMWRIKNNHCEITGEYLGETDD